MSTAILPQIAGSVSPAWEQSIDGNGPIDISVCIANWNCREMLRKCLESLQTS